MSIEVQRVTKHFGAFTALADVDLSVQDGDLLALLGPSGSGKTTLLRIIAGLEFPDSGRVLIDGEDTAPKSVGERGIGFVFQHYALFKHMSVFENVAFGLRVRARRERPSEAEIRSRVEELLELVQLAGLGERGPSQLSGGSASAWRWPGRSRCARACCCSTSPSAPSTRACARSCGAGCASSTTSSTSRACS